MKYYVYTLAYPDGRVFYVGKGQGNRIDHHEYEARSGKNITNPYKVRVIRKIWAGGGEVVKEKVYETNDEEASLEVEMGLISSYGRSNLTNLTDGGEGTSGHKGGRAKVWDGFIDPLGIEHRNIKNLYAFCEEYDLTYYLMVDVHNGKADAHKGWRRIDYQDPRNPYGDMRGRLSGLGQFLYKRIMQRTSVPLDDEMLRALEALRVMNSRNFVTLLETIKALEKRCT